MIVITQEIGNCFSKQSNSSSEQKLYKLVSIDWNKVYNYAVSPPADWFHPFLWCMEVDNYCIKEIYSKVMYIINVYHLCRHQTNKF